MKEQPLQLILASGSPRRSHLLREAGYSFRVANPGIAEIEDSKLPIRLVTAENARRKASAVAENSPDAVVLAADTLVLLGDTVLSKPADAEDASRMLALLSGRSHEVVTAVALVRLAAKISQVFLVTTKVHFKSLSAEERSEYHRKINPLDKAGGYAAQEHGELIIERIEGSTTNVIGLPMDELSKVLEERFKISPLV